LALEKQADCGPGVKVGTGLWGTSFAFIVLLEPGATGEKCLLLQAIVETKNPRIKNPNKNTFFMKHLGYQKSNKTFKSYHLDTDLVNE
jgi:hypothetical protein